MGSMVSDDHPNDELEPGELARLVRIHCTGRQADVMLRALAGHGTRRIARDMGLAKATVTEHLQAARKRIRRATGQGDS